MQGGIKWKELKDASISDWGRSLIYPAEQSHIGCTVNVAPGGLYFETKARRLSRQPVGSRIVNTSEAGFA